MKQQANSPEISYVIQFVLPFLSTHYDYPIQDDYEYVKIDEIPVRIGSSVKKPDAVYYWAGVPVALIETKKEGKSEPDAQEQALSYIRNFPASDKDYFKDGLYYSGDLMG